jgi:glycosyltransferase involved in cell wall biosynthesis
MSGNQTELTVLMPCLNEEATIGTCISKALKCMKENGIHGEVLIADNGSLDRSIVIAEQLGARVINVAEKGYGNALLAGIREAHGKFVIMGDSDDSYDFSKLMPFIEKLREGYDLVMGNRFKGGIQKGAMPPLHRYLGNPVLSFTGRLFFRIGIRDFHCGLRGFNRESILGIGLNTTGMEFASEMVVKSALNNLKICEVPTTLAKDGREHPPHLNTWRDGWRHLRFLLIYSPRWLFLYPGLFFMLAGLILSIILMTQSLNIGRVRLDIHTLLYANTLIILGFQFISFFAFAKLFAITSGLLPQSKNFDKLFRYFNLEKGILAGIAVIITGIALSVRALVLWESVSFGNLDPIHVLRLVIPGCTCIILGTQILLNSFFLSMLGLKS